MIDLARLSLEDRRVCFAATLAQVEDVHSLMFSLNDEQCDRAAEMCEEFWADGTVLGRALGAALMVAAYDVDHLDLESDEWAALEEFHELLEGCLD